MRRSKRTWKGAKEKQPPLCRDSDTNDSDTENDNDDVTRGSFNPPGGEIPVCSQGGVAIDANSITDPEFDRLGLS